MNLEFGGEYTVYGAGYCAGNDPPRVSGADRQLLLDCSQGSAGDRLISRAAVGTWPRRARATLQELARAAGRTLTIRRDEVEG